MLLTFFFTLLFYSGFSQIQIGIKGGGNVSNVEFEGNTSKTHYRLAYQAGIFGNFPLAQKFSLRTEILYYVKGWRFPATQYGGSGTLSLYYINAPVLLGYKPAAKTTILLGTEAGWLTGVVSRFDGKKADLSSMYRKTDIGVAIGLAHLLNSKLGLEMRYIHGFNNLSKIMLTDANGAPTRTIKDGSNRSLQVGVFYLLHEK
jgi:hypothetical protein